MSRSVEVEDNYVQNFGKMTTNVHCKLSFVFVQENIGVSVMHSVHINAYCTHSLIWKGDMFCYVSIKINLIMFTITLSVDEIWKKYNTLNVQHSNKLHGANHICNSCNYCTL